MSTRSRRAEPAPDRQPEADPEITNHQSPREPAKPPERTEADAPRKRRALGVANNVEETRTRHARQQERKDDKPEDRIDEPVALVMHILDAAERQRENRPGETTGVVIGNVIFASMAGYAFAKIRFKGSSFLFGLILVAMMIPYQVTQVPLYILMVQKFSMTNTYAAMILPGLCTAYNIFLCKQFFSGLPTPLIESAKIAGCNQFQIFIKIILPLSKTVLAVMAINTFMSSWNDFFWPFLVTNDPAMYTIQVGLKQFKFANETLFAPMMAGATISALPMFVMFFALQKYFMEGVTIGAVKG